MKLLPLVALTTAIWCNGCLKKAPTVPASEVKVGNSDLNITDPSLIHPAVIKFSSFPAASSSATGQVRGASCSGTFIAPDLLLTAWHCIEDINNGGITYDGTKSTNVYLHQKRLWQTNVDSMALDIAVVEFPAPIAPAILPLAKRKPAPGEFVEVVGYGEAGFSDDAFYTKNGLQYNDQTKRNSSGIKRVGIATIKDGSERLVDTNGTPVPVEEMVVTRPDPTGAYIQPGDSGGGLIQDNAIVGVNSHGPSEARVEGRYSFFVDINSEVSQKMLKGLANRIRVADNRPKGRSEIESTLTGDITVNPSAFCRCKRAEENCIVYKDGDERARAWTTPGEFGRCSQELCNAMVTQDQSKTPLQLEFNNQPGFQISACNGYATCVNYNCLD